MLCALNHYPSRQVVRWFLYVLVETKVVGRFSGFLHPSSISILSRCLAFLNAVRARLVPASRLEARADPLQKCPYFLAKGMHFRFVDQLQHGLGIHERNRYGSIGFFAHDHVAR